MAQRLQKFLAHAGVASRRQAERIIQAGRVTVNGQVVTKLGSTVEPDDIVKVDNKSVKPATELVYYALNKPKGMVTTSRDEQGRKTVLDLVPPQPRVVACGRLDADSRGLVILTNDGDLCYQLTHPKFGHAKEYEVTATINRGAPLEDRLNQLSQGIQLAEGMTQPATLTHVKRRSQQLSFRIVLKEGRYRQVRRMCSAVGLDVVDLTRQRVGQVELGDLVPGRWRPLQREEIV